jgi:hypothetical protein
LKLTPNCGMRILANSQLSVVSCQLFSLLPHLLCRETSACYVNASGCNAIASAGYVNTSGRNAIASACYVNTSGCNAIASGDNAIASGDNMIVSGCNAIASGDNAIVSGDNAIVLGNIFSSLCVLCVLCGSIKTPFLQKRIKRQPIGQRSLCPWFCCSQSTRSCAPHNRLTQRKSFVKCSC